MTTRPVILGKDLEKHYRVGGGFMREAQTVKALRGVSFSLEAGRTLAVVGESGCGKSTLARLVTMIEEPTAGVLKIDGFDLTSGDRHMRKALRSAVQIVFQDPYGSLNPRQKIGAMLEEPLLINTPDSAEERQDKAREMLRLVGLRPEHYDRYPHMFSGGQRQRIAIARALMLNPRIVVLDEPVSALDVSIQAQILNLLAKLQEKLQLAYIFIAHNLSVVRHVADDVMVMYLGRAVETASRDEIFAHPRHPYTQALLSPTPSTRSTESALRANFPRPSTRRAAAPSTRAARWRSIAAAPRCPNSTPMAVQGSPATAPAIRSPKSRPEEQAHPALRPPPFAPASLGMACVRFAGAMRLINDGACRLSSVALIASGQAALAMSQRAGEPSTVVHVVTIPDVASRTRQGRSHEQARSLGAIARGNRSRSRNRHERVARLARCGHCCRLGAGIVRRMVRLEPLRNRFADRVRALPHRCRSARRHHRDGDCHRNGRTDQPGRHLK